MTKVAIDGPAGAGKSTISKKIARPNIIKTGKYLKNIIIKKHILIIEIS
jgi:cytidylate kinase